MKAMMNDDGKCTKCGDWARDCSCWQCPDCGAMVEYDDDVCGECYYCLCGCKEAESD